MKEEKKKKLSQTKWRKFVTSTPALKEMLKKSPPEKRSTQFPSGRASEKKQKKAKQNLSLLKLYIDRTHRSDSNDILGDYSIWKSEIKMSDIIRDRKVKVAILL